MLDLVFRNTTRKNAFPEAFFRLLISRTLKAAKFRHSVEVSVNLVGPRKMQQLNRHYRRKNAVTDVLSFPLAQRPLPRYTGVILGDIFICPSYAAARAKAEHLPLKQKMAWLVVHGTLHLLGYDHEKSPAAARNMQRLENTILHKA